MGKYKKVQITLSSQGMRMRPFQRKAIIDMLESGQYPNLSQIARKAMVTRQTIYRMLREDPDLRQRWEAALAFQADDLANTAVEMCKDDSLNPIAREKMIEFMLPKLHPERFGEKTQLDISMKNATRRVIVVPTLPTIEVDENGIPLKKQDCDEEVVEVNASVSPSPIKDE